MYYFNARWYDPELGRFITEDPIKDGVNWFAYCRNNPLRYIDPTGLFLQEAKAAFAQAGTSGTAQNAKQAGLIAFGAAVTYVVIDNATDGALTEGLMNMMISRIKDLEGRKMGCLEIEKLNRNKSIV